MCVPTPRLPQPSWATRMRSFAPMDRARCAAVSGLVQAAAAATATPVLRKSRRGIFVATGADGVGLFMRKGKLDRDNLVHVGDDVLGPCRVIHFLRMVRVLGDQPPFVADIIERLHH